MRIPSAGVASLNLRAQSLLADLPIEDAWVMPLRGGGPGRTVLDVRSAVLEGRQTAPWSVQALLRMRGTLGRMFGWDRPRPEWFADSFSHRLSAALLEGSSVRPGTPDGTQKLLFRFPDEQLSEIRNGTVHAFSSLSLRETPGGYLAYLAVYVRPVHRLTGLYMALIRPFRRWVVYPAVARKVQNVWSRRYSP